MNFWDRCSSWDAERMRKRQAWCEFLQWRSHCTTVVSMQANKRPLRTRCLLLRFAVFRSSTSTYRTPKRKDVLSSESLLKLTQIPQIWTSENVIQSPNHTLLLSTPRHLGKCRLWRRLETTLEITQARRRLMENQILWICEIILRPLRLLCNSILFFRLTLLFSVIILLKYFGDFKWHSSRRTKWVLQKSGLREYISIHHCIM